ncbi:MAG: hypothetical protein AAB731_05245 [Patescibacteria group bacterium]
MMTQNLINNWPMVAVLILLAMLGVYILYLVVDLVMAHLIMRQAMKESDMEPSDELLIDDGEDEPTPIAWTADCSCGWNAPVGSSRGYFLATSEAEATKHLRTFHDAQLKTRLPVLLYGGTHELAVYPL